MPAGLSDLADSDPDLDEAYQHGQNNEPFDAWWERRASSRPSPTRPSSPPPRRTPSSPGRVRGAAGRMGSRVSGGADDLAGALLGAVGYALVLSVVDYGTAGPGMWFRAKFLNETQSQSGSGGTPVAGSDPNSQAVPGDAGVPQSGTASVQVPSSTPIELA